MVPLGLTWRGESGGLPEEGMAMHGDPGVPGESKQTQESRKEDSASGQ